MSNITKLLVCDFCRPLKLTADNTDETCDIPELDVSPQNLSKSADLCMTCSMIYCSLKGLIGEGVRDVHEIRITSYPDQPIRIRVGAIQQNVRGHYVAFELWKYHGELHSL